MGEVYVAHDSRLDRRVAVKFLPAHLSTDAAFKARFEHEARAAAALNHPNIVTIHQLGEHEGRHFIVMELVPGQSLEARIQSGSVSVEQALEIVAQITDGLAAAHVAGVIHRDIKPANILVDPSGRARILDFGLAKSSRATTITDAGTTVGTVYYESPEQSFGKPVDARSDLFSLGIVFYELLAGRRPFEGEFADAVRYAIAHEPPAPLARFASGLSPRLQDIVSRLLEKDPQLRFQSARDLSAELKRLRGGSPQRAPEDTVKQQASLVVLPFENHSGDAADEYFSDGLTEEVITDLANLDGVRVISRKSAMQLKGTSKDVRTLGRELNVHYVLTGSVRKAGASLRVHAALVDAASDQQLWAERFTGSMEDVFDIQEKVARATAHAIKVKLTVKEDADLRERPVRSAEAYDLYLRARSETARWDKPGLDRAAEYLAKADALEPNNPVILAAIGYGYYNYVNMGFHQDESTAKALDYAGRALVLKPDSLDAHRLMGVICLSLTAQTHRGLKHLHHVLDRSPEDTEALWWASLCSGFLGMPDEGVKLGDRLIAVDPLVPINHGPKAFSLYMAGRFGEALETIDVFYQREPQNALAQFCRALVLFYLGRVDEAEGFIAVARARPFMSFLDKLILVQLYAYRGNRAEVEKLMDADVLKSASRDIQYPWHLAVARTLLGDYDEALTHLETVVQNGFGNHRFLTEFDPFLKPLHPQPRFVALIERMRS